MPDPNSSIKQFLGNDTSDLEQRQWDYSLYEQAKADEDALTFWQVVFVISMGVLIWSGIGVGIGLLLGVASTIGAIILVFATVAPLWNLYVMNDGWFRPKETMGVLAAHFMTFIAGGALIFVFAIALKVVDGPFLIDAIFREVMIFNYIAACLLPGIVRGHYSEFDPWAYLFEGFGGSSSAGGPVSSPPPERTHVVDSSGRIRPQDALDRSDRSRFAFNSPVASGSPSDLRRARSLAISSSGADEGVVIDGRPQPRAIDMGAKPLLPAPASPSVEEIIAKADASLNEALVKSLMSYTPPPIQLPELDRPAPAKPVERVEDAVIDMGAKDMADARPAEAPEPAAPVVAAPLSNPALNLARKIVREHKGMANLTLLGMQGAMSERMAELGATRADVQAAMEEAVKLKNASDTFSAFAAAYRPLLDAMSDNEWPPIKVSEPA